MKKKILLVITGVLSIALMGCNKTCNDKNSTFENVAEKPVIYLYNYGGQEVTVKLNLDGELTCTYPQYNEKKGWIVKAATNGTLKVDDTSYNYLYWEGTLNTKYDFTKGFCVKGSETAAFLEQELRELGLNERETNEFIIYWLPRMQGNPYNVISFQTKAYTSKAELEVTPKPDKTFRVFMAWYPSDTVVELEKQEFNIPSRNSGKILVEWGGAEVNPDSKEQIYGEENFTDQALIEGLSKKNTLEINTILAQVALLWQQNGTPNGVSQTGTQQTSASSPAATSGHYFIDKNGSTTTFTDAEWEKLVNTWIYVGSRSAAEELISHHTISELRKVLGQ